MKKILISLLTFSSVSAFAIHHPPHTVYFKCHKHRGMVRPMVIGEWQFAPSDCKKHKTYIFTLGGTSMWTWTPVKAAYLANSGLSNAMSGYVYTSNRRFPNHLHNHSGPDITIATYVGGSMVPKGGHWCKIHKFSHRCTPVNFYHPPRGRGVSYQCTHHCRFQALLK